MLLCSTSILVAVAIHKPVIAEEIPWWNETFDFRQQIKLPTSLLSASSEHDPIDITINFTNQCWAEHNQHHSIRIIHQTNTSSQELESQIYQLNYSEKPYLDSCSIVFLLPKNLSNKENIFVYYDNQETTQPNYPDRVAITEDQFQYEPVNGYRFETWYYAITQTDDLIYTIAQEGNFMGNPIAQQITKMKPNTLSFSPQQTEQTASFSLSYWYKNDDAWTKMTTAQKLQSTEIIVDGNLMIQCGIVSRSADDIFQTTAIYTYYYSPHQKTRLLVDVTHELTDNAAPSADAIDVFFASLTSGGLSSTTYNDLNFGTIPSSLYIYTNDNQTVEYALTTNPDSAWEPILGRKANIELGSPGWCCLDSGTDQPAHAIIFSSNSILKTGADEQDGVEIQAYEEKLNDQPGVSSTSAYIYFSRNTYDPSSGRDTTLPNNYKISFSAEFFSTQTGGYQTIKPEATYFSALSKLTTIKNTTISGNGSQKGDLSLTVNTLLTPGLTLEYLSSKIAFTGSSIIAELYQNETQYASNICSRIETTNTSSINWKNSSIFLNTQFNHLPKKPYVIKIFLTNSLISKTKRFIGVATVDLTKNDTIQILCRQQGTIQLSINDQQNNGLSNASGKLILNQLIINQETTDQNGHITLHAPCSLFDHQYTLQTTYNGFLVDKTPINLGYHRSILPLTITQSIPVYDTQINIKQADGHQYTKPAALSLTSQEMTNPTTLIPTTIENGIYTFENIPAATYQIQLQYGSFFIQKPILIENDTIHIIQLTELSLYIKDTWNLTPAVPLDIFLTNEKYLKGTYLTPDVTDNGLFIFPDLYPAKYNISIGYKSFTRSATYDSTENISINDTINFQASYNLSMTIYDSHGLPLKDTMVSLQRENQKKNVHTNHKGKATIKLAPATYNLYLTENKATRNVTITNHKSISVVSSNAPLYPVLIWIISGISILFAGLLILWKKQRLHLFVLIVIIAALFSFIVFPWWSYTGTNENVEQSTNVYLLTHSFVSHTETSTVQAGEIINPTEEVISLTVYTEILALVGSILLIITALLHFLQWKKTTLLVLLLSILLLASSLILFYTTMNTYTETSVGSIIGLGTFNSNIPGEETSITLESSWGLGIGFYGVLGITAILIVFFFRLLYNMGYLGFIRRHSEGKSKR